MSDYDFDEFDSAFFNEVDRITTTAPPAISPAKPQHPPRSRPAPPQLDSDGFDLTLELNEDDVAKLDEEFRRAEQIAAAGPRRPLHQANLFGERVVSPTRPMSNPTPRLHLPTRNPVGSKAKKVKEWDYSLLPVIGKQKRKKKKPGEDEDRSEEDEPPARVEPPPPMKLRPDLQEIRTWVYPTNKPRRDYQYNIVKHCLFENALVALPTGLGKTFIAGVVMLNYYKWFPEGKIIFVAPAKPLVNQQVEACHEFCGIPGTDAAALTGETKAATRAGIWAEKRVFYMTPQTFMNDLLSNNCDPEDVVLLVVDEAHRASGEYSYVQIVRFMMQKNPHIRILALTATPGNDTKSVQAVIDKLHISHIEIRNENSLDLRQFIFKKEVRTHVISPTGPMIKIRDLIGKAMLKHSFQRLRDLDVLKWGDCTTLAPYTCIAAMGEINKRRDAASLKWAYPALRILASLARLMSYLTELGANMCYIALKHLLAGVPIEDEEEQDKQDKQDKTDKQDRARQNASLVQTALQKNEEITKVVHELEELQKSADFRHPKLQKLIDIADQHFHSAQDKQTKMMVFVTYRDCVDELVEALKCHSDIQPTRFVGQGTDCRGGKGITQEEQLKIIEDFKGSHFNVLVSTSIGEEGLDIGEIDRIVCYDAQSSSIRMLQRIGRTGRKRKGYVDVLLSEGREERNWKKAQDTYENVQDTISRGENLELYNDVERLIPDSVKPQPLELTMEIIPYQRSPAKKRKRTDGPAPRKRPKRDAEYDRNITTGEEHGFVSVMDLIVKGAAKSKSKKNKALASVLDLDDDSETLGESSTRKRTAKPKRKSTKAKSTRKETPRLGSPSSSQFERELIDDEVDEEIENGLSLFSAKKKSPKYEEILSDRELSPSPPRPSKPQRTQDSLMSWLIDDEPQEVRVSTPARVTQTSRTSASRLVQTPVSSSPPVRVPPKRPKPHHVQTSSPAPSPTRKHPPVTSETPPPKKKARAINKRWADIEAAHSGEDTSSGESDVDMVESESDRRFLHDLPPTQLSSSYNQMAAYRLGLLTQAPNTSSAPSFTSKPKRTGKFAGGRERNLTRGVNQTMPYSDDRYSLDSFVVEDDDGILGGPSTPDNIA